MDSERIFTRAPAPADQAPAHRRFRVAPPVTWLAGAVLLVAVLGTVIWCAAGTMIQSVTMTGIVFPQYGIEQITSQVDGVVSYVQVEVGDSVEAGDLIAIVPQEDLFQQIQEARAAQAAPEELEQLYGAYQAASMIYTPVSGRVVDLVETGSAIQTGDLVVGITNADSTTNEAEIRAYVPSTVAQSIKKGMEVRVYPSASGADSYGYVQGLVSGISSYPITETDISETLGRFYTSQIVPQNENIVEIRVTLLGGTDGATGAWSRAEGGSLSIDTGTLCEMEVIVDEMTPWEYLRS